MANPKSKLDWFPLDTRMLEDPKIRKLVHKYKLEGFGLYVHILSRIYLNGYFIKDNLDSFSEDISYDLGYNDTEEHMALVKEIIEYMMKINLLDSYSYEYESVFTSRAIQIQFVKSTLRRVPREKPHWLLTPEEEADARTYMKKREDESV